MALDPILILISVGVLLVLPTLTGRSPGRRAKASPYIGCDKDGRSLVAPSGGYYGIGIGGGHGPIAAAGATAGTRPAAPKA